MVSPLLFRKGLEKIATRRLDVATPYHKQAYAHLKKGDYDLAFIEHSTAVGIDRDNAGAYSERGHVYMLKGEYDLAVTA